MTTDPSGLLDLGKVERGIWDALGGMINFLGSMPAGDLRTADKLGMASGYSDYLSGLLTAAEGLTENPAFGQVRDLISTANGLANNGLMVAGTFRMAKGPPSIAAPVASSNLAQQRTNFLSGAAQRAVKTVGPGKGGAYGTKVHSQFAKEVKALGRKDLATEVSYLNGKRVPWGTPGSVRVDVVHGPVDAPTAISDLKTGSANLTQARIEQIQSHIPGGRSVPVRQVRI